MVSTRGIRYKFSEGERVLCYEPDPTKAKVLYDSKVLEVIENKDKRGRRTVEYLIHFQGWNSSWDRCVSEDFVLKDTVENRHLQRDLADKSQLQLGAYLYRRERKKGGGTPGAGSFKRSRLGFSDDGSSSSTQPDEGEVGDTDSSGSGSGSQPHSPPPNAQSGRAHINLPSALRNRLTFDYHLVVKRGWLSRVPASPCAAQILESFVKWFARAGAWRPTRGRHDPPQRPDLLDVSCRLNLVREVADGMRVYFDFILRGHLLYKQEHGQYQEVCGRFLDAQEEGKSEMQGESQPASEPNLSVVEEDLKSPKMPEYAHLPPDPMDGEKNGAVEVNSHEETTVKLEPSDIPATHKVMLASEHQNLTSAGKVREGRASRRTRNLARSVGSSGSSLSENWALPAQTGASVPPTTRTPLSLLLDKVSKWQIIPREGTEHLPCRVYGAIHLARLFVKLPQFLNATQMPDFKLKLVLKHIDMFVQYLDEHGEWFGEMYYIADNASRSH